MEKLFETVIEGLKDEKTLKLLKEKIETPLMKYTYERLKYAILVAESALVILLVNTLLLAWLLFFGRRQRVS